MPTRFYRDYWQKQKAGLQKPRITDLVLQKLRNCLKIIHKSNCQSERLTKKVNRLKFKQILNRLFDYLRIKIF